MVDWNVIHRAHIEALETLLATRDAEIDSRKTEAENLGRDLDEATARISELETKIADRPSDVRCNNCGMLTNHPTDFIDACKGVIGAKHDWRLRVQPKGEQT